MDIVAKVLVGVVAVLHVWFLVLEMFLWRGPQGRRTHGLSAADAEVTATLAANQGIYNGFVAAGLLYSLVAPTRVAFHFAVFFLVGVIVLGLYGAATASRRIVFFQSLPAALALAAVLVARA